MPETQPDLYSILQVHPQADSETIRQIYRILARKYHPDTAPVSMKNAYEDRMKEINAAYEILCEPEARQKYDAIFVSDVKLESHQFQFELAAILAAAASAGGGAQLCYTRSTEILTRLVVKNVSKAVTHEALVRLAQIQYKGLQEYGSAATTLNKLLVLTTDRKERDELLIYIAESYWKGTNYKDSVATYDRLLVECKDAEVIRMAEAGKADGFYKMSNYQSALNAYQLLTKKYPGSELAATGHFMRARIFDSNLNRWSDAILEYRIVMESYSNTQFASDCKWRIDHIQRKHIEKKAWWES
jgi:curved DNA-binding protein CbpA